MRLGNRGKIAIHISLWATAGIALLALPGLLATTSTTNTEHPISVPTGIYTATTSNARPPQPVTTQTQADSRDFILRLVLILIPATAVSGLVKNWTDKRMRNVWT